MHVYTPPGYQLGEGTFPVFYLLHGAGDSDDSWTTVGRAGFILDNLIAAGRALLRFGPRFVIVKKGEHGSFLFSNYFQYALPAYPTDQVVDPTGAGDSFAGGFMGFIAECDSLSLWNMKRAMAYGTVCASLNVEGFGVEPLAATTREHLERRYRDLIQFVSV